MSFVQLVEHSADQTQCKLKIKDVNNLFHTQNWQIDYSESKKSYISPIYVHPAFKIIFKLEFGDTDIKLYINLADYNNYDTISFYFLFTDPSNPNFNLNIEKKISFNYQDHCKCVTVSSEKMPLGDHLNIYFELHYQMPTNCIESNNKIIIKPKPKEEDPNKGNKGLVKLNNICFLNASCQVIYHVPLIRSILYSNKIEAIKAKKVLLNTVCLFRQMEEAERPTSAKKLCFSIDKYAENYGNHMDAEEFIIRWLDILEQDMKDSDNGKQLKDLFGFTMDSVIETKQYRIDASKSDDDSIQPTQKQDNSPETTQSSDDLVSSIRRYTVPYSSLKIPIKSYDKKEEKTEEEEETEEEEKKEEDEKKEEELDLIELIKRIGEKDTISVSGEDGTEIIKWDEFNELPPILKIDLIRYASSSESPKGCVKLYTLVNFPEKLELNKTEYHLYAVVSHSGTNEGGHYVSYIRNFPSDKWYKYNEDFVQDINFEQELNTLKRSAYVIFYVREDKIEDLFAPSKIPPELDQFVAENIAQEEAEIKNKDLIKFKFFVEDEMIDKFTADPITSSQTLTISSNESKMNLYEKVASLFGKKVDDIRLWTVTKYCTNGRLINKLIYEKIGGIANMGYDFIFVQNLKKGEYVSPGSNIVDFNTKKIQYRMYIVKFFDTRMEQPLHYMGTIIVYNGGPDELQEINKLLGFPEWTRYYYFDPVDQCNISEISEIKPTRIVSYLRTITVQIDFESTEKESKLSEEELKNFAPYDLSKSAAFKDIKLISSTPIQQEQENAAEAAQIKTNKGGLKYITKDGIDDYLYSIDTRKADKYIIDRFYTRHFTVYDIQNQTKPHFTIKTEIKTDEKDFRVLICRKILNKNGVVLLFTRKGDSNLPSENPITGALENNSLLMKYNELFYLHWPKPIEKMGGNIVLRVEIAIDGYNVSYVKYIVCPKSSTPKDILQTLKDLFKDFPKKILPAVKYDDAKNIKLLNKTELPQQKLTLKKESPKKESPKKGTIGRTQSSEIVYPKYYPRCYVIKDFTIYREYMMNDQIDFAYKTIRFATFISYDMREVTVKVYQAKIDQEQMLRCFRDPFFMNVRLKSTVSQFKEKVKKYADDVDENELKNAKIEIWHPDDSKKFSDYAPVKKSSGKFITNDDKELIGLTGQSIVYIIYN